MARALYLLCPLLILSDKSAAAAQQSQVTQAKPPNIIMIFADDLGWGDVGFNGRTEWRTPHLDRLAAQGTNFRRWYTAGVVCAPSRAALMTGKYGIHNGVSGNSDDLPNREVTIAEALKRRGYVTALFGKWHHGKPRPGNPSYRHPMDLGFDEFVGFTNARHAWEHFPKELWFGREMKSVNGNSETIFTDQSIDFITRHKGRPFFLYLAYISPHLKIEAPEEEIARHRGKFNEKDPNQPLNATYAAMITHMDKEIGRLMKVLDDFEIANNTLVVFSSDHGATFEPGNQGTSAYHDSNRPFRGQKRNLWEGGIRVPSLVRWPGKAPAGRVSNEIIHMTDVMPSFLAAVGAAPDPAWKVDGRNMLSVWMGKEKAPERTLFWEWRAEGYYQLAALRGDFKLVITDKQLFDRLTVSDSTASGTVIRQPEMFNVENDPAERRSIVFEHLPLARQLLQELKEWIVTETEESKWGKLADQPATATHSGTETRRKP